MNLNELIAYIEKQLDALFPDNAATTPIAWSKEREADGSYIYAAYIEVRTPSQEFDTRGTSVTSPQVAMARAMNRLQGQLSG